MTAQARRRGGMAANAAATLTAMRAADSVGAEPAAGEAAPSGPPTNSRPCARSARPAEPAGPALAAGRRCVRASKRKAVRYT